MADDLHGAAYVAWCCTLTASAVGLSTLVDHWLAWIAGQGLLALALLLWFVLLHEAGHRTLFKSRIGNDLAGQAAGFFSLIPFYNWRLVHARHHQWTGWQDMDVTTEALTPRPLRRSERWLVNAAWRYWLPLFSVLYRINNFWNLRRLRRFFADARQRRRLARGCAALGGGYLLLLWVFGPIDVLTSLGLGTFIALVLQDPIILSQHTHIPQELARGRSVTPFTAREQQRFTRSLRFPAWFSALFLMHFDAHELHHVFVKVPGYRLRSLSLENANEVHWWEWLKAAKRLRGEEFLFLNSRQTGFTL